MYADEVQDALDAADAEPGDIIRVDTPEETYEGRLMPRSGQGDEHAIVLKLDNGYNTGVRYTDDVEIDRVAEREADAADRPDVPEPDPDAPDIAILHTGGTIA
ncbi:MAG: Glu-tRNA(Gln) amidotransferase GatDE subunit D, partial [Candidatus Nanohaloarchaea archaeon]